MRRMLLLLVLGLVLASSLLIGGTHEAQAVTTCRSMITSVTAFNTSNHQTVYISGQCLGSRNAYTNADSRYLRITALGFGGPWNACYTGDYVGCSISYWGNNEIVFKGFTGAYGQQPYVLHQKQAIAIQELNPENPQLWWTCSANVGSPSNCAEF